MSNPGWARERTVVWRRAVTNENDQGTRREQRRAKNTEASRAAGSDADAMATNPEDIRDRNARLRAKAAADRQSKRERDKARIAATAAGLDASERLDDVFVRTTHAVTTWIRQNFRWIQWALVIVVIGMFTVQGIRYYERQVAAKSADALMAGVIAQSGTITNEEQSKETPEELQRWDNRPMFASTEQRASTAEKELKEAVSKYGHTGAGEYARLQLAGVKYDEKAFDEALTLYQQVRASKLAEKDIEVKGRAIEGAGFCLEGKGDTEGALKSFRELSNLEGSLEFAVLGLYHQARVMVAQNKTEEAKTLLKKAEKRLDDEKDSVSASYYRRPVQELLSRVDPSAVSAPTQPDLQELLQRDPSRLQRMLENMKQKGPPAPGDSPEGP